RPPIRRPEVWGGLPPTKKPSHPGGGETQRVAFATRFRGDPFLRAVARQKFLPPNIPLGTKFGAEPRTRRKAARTLSAPNFPVCVPTVRTCRPLGTLLTV